MRLATGLLGLWFAVSAAAQQAPPAMRFSLRPDTLALPQCVAQPGNVPAPLNRTNVNLEIVNWSTTPTPTNQAGEFVLRFVTPTPVGAVIAYEPGEISYFDSGSWKTLSPGSQGGRKLQVIPVPPGIQLEALKFIVPAQAVKATGGPTDSPQYRATLPFLTLISVRMANLAASARVNASSTNGPNNAATLIDGSIELERNFSTGVSSNEWVSLEWDQPQSFRGFAFLHGRFDEGLRQIRIEVQETNGWKQVLGRATVAGAFRGNQFFASMEQLTTRSVRLTRTGLGRISLGELVVLANLGNAPAPEAPIAFTEKTWTIPKTEPAQIKVDGSTEDWPTNSTNGFNLAFDEQALHLLYRAQGPAAEFANFGTNINELFFTGDALDLQLQTQPRLDPKRIAPGPGDLRLIFSEFQGKPVCVLYDYRSDDLLLLPVTFRTESGAVSCDKVKPLTNAVIKVERKESEFRLEATVPWTALGTKPTVVAQTRGDVGRLFSNKNGPGVSQRVYWSNPVTNAPADLAAAADLQPKRWSVLRFGEKVER